MNIIAVRIKTILAEPGVISKKGRHKNAAAVIAQLFFGRIIGLLKTPLNKFFNFLKVVSPKGRKHAQVLIFSRFAKPKKNSKPTRKEVVKVLETCTV